MAPIRVVAIPLQKDRLRAVPKSERSVFLLLGHAANQIIMFQKLLLFSSNKTPEEPIEQRLSGAQTHMLLRFLIGAEHEAWILITKRYLSSRIGKSYQQLLNNVGKVALDNLKKYFGSNNTIEIIRNSYAYHHPLKDDEVDAAFVRAIDDGDWDDYWNLYLSDAHLNCFHFASDVVIVHGIMKAVGAHDLISAQQKITEEVSQVAIMLTDFIFDFSAAFMAKHFSIDPSKAELQGIEGPRIENAPDLLEFWLPFYVKV